MHRHPSILLVNSLLHKVNFKLREERIAELKQKQGLWRILALEIYEHPNIVLFLANSTEFFLGAIGLGLITILTTGNKQWISIFCLSWLFIHLVNFLSWQLFYLLVRKELHILTGFLVRQETETLMQRRWRGVAVCYMRMRRIDREDAEREIQSAINYCHRQSRFAVRLICFLATGVGTVFYSSSEFQEALITFPWTWLLTSIWDADQFGASSLVALLFSYIYYLRQFGFDLARLEYVLAQFEFDLRRTNHSSLI